MKFQDYGHFCFVYVCTYLLLASMSASLACTKWQVNNSEAKLLFYCVRPHSLVLLTCSALLEL